MPYQGQPTLGSITLKPGQESVLADKTVPTDYYRATSYYNQLPGDGTVIRGQERYYQTWVGHRFGHVTVPDVDVLRSGRRERSPSPAEPEPATPADSSESRSTR